MTFAFISGFLLLPSQMEAIVMVNEPTTEMKTIQSIMDQSIFEAEVDYCGREYRTYIWSTTRSDGTEVLMRVIMGEKGWSLCPAEWPIEKCFM